MAMSTVTQKLSLQNVASSGYHPTGGFSYWENAQ